MSKRHISSHKIVCWRFTRWCNRSCPFCLSRSGPDHSHSRRDLQSYFARLASVGVEKLSYSGGEALGHPQFPEALELGHRTGIRQLLTTNGDSLVRRVPKFLNRLEYLKLSFYGDCALHDRTMGRRHYRLLLGVTRRLIQQGIQVGANYMLTKQSELAVERFLSDASAAGVSQVLILRYIPTGVNQLDAVLDPGDNFSGSLRGRGLSALSRRLSSLASGFPNGVKIHDFSYSDFFCVLNEEDHLVLPRHRAPPFVMGNLFDDTLFFPGRDGALPAAEALDLVWAQRYKTEAIVPVEAILPKCSK